MINDCVLLPIQNDVLALHEDELICRVRARYELVTEFGGCNSHDNRYLLNVASGGVFLAPRAATKDTSLDLEATSKPLMKKVDSTQRTPDVCQISPVLNILP